jgi:pimeloyl-ACP methyl ester carboxylesterase
MFRIFMVMILGLVAGVAVWTSVTNQRIDLTEDVPARSIELVDPSMVGDIRVNVVAEPGGPVPVILLHERDIVGSALWDDVAVALSGRYKAVRVDLPGYGLSDRLPDEGPGHTVAAMAQVVSSVIEERFDLPVVLVGAGLGGKVAAELAVSNPDVVRGVVLVDVDFWEENSWVEIVERLPWIGRAATFTLETGGRFAVDMWAPNCDNGGWCPSQQDLTARTIATSIKGSTETMRAFLRTRPSALVPSDLSEITAPVVFVWSRDGDVPSESVRRAEDAIPDMTVIEVEVWKAYLESPSSVAAAIDTVGR